MKEYLQSASATHHPQHGHHLSLNDDFAKRQKNVNLYRVVALLALYRVVVILALYRVVVVLSLCRVVAVLRLYRVVVVLGLYRVASS